MVVRSATGKEFVDHLGLVGTCANFLTAKGVYEELLDKHEKMLVEYQAMLSFILDLAYDQCLRGGKCENTNDKCINCRARDVIRYCRLIRKG